ncbi:hypothetical protein [Corynebacterium sp.]|uniref:hypothetical protein n=1 Tax=Corynebacterium sp. TaxID=1720 RepID=UPI0028A950EB|nr:hypothetical protein [Corynebacterium sp.]
MTTSPGVSTAHTVTGHAVGNAMNFALTMAVHGAIARETNTPLVFPGTELVWNCLTDITDSRAVADQMIWASTTPGIGNEAWNVTNGEVFRWRSLWPRLADALGVEVEVVADMTKSHMAGFNTYIDTERASLELFDRYEADGLVPPRR